MYEAIGNSLAGTRNSRWAFVPLVAGWMLTAHAAGYTVTDLCIVAQMPDSGCHAAALNEAGDVAGEVFVNDQPQLAVWKHGTYINLGASLPSDITSFAAAINDADEIAGEIVSTSDGILMAYSWNADEGAAAGPVAYQSEATGINAQGTVVGWSQPVMNGAVRGWLQRGKRVTYLPGLVAGALDVSAAGINDKGDVVGVSSISAATDSAIHAVVWSQSKVVDLGTLPHTGAGTDSIAFAINNTGSIVGISGLSPGPKAPSSIVVWKDGVIRALPSTLPGTFQSIPYAINDCGDVVGQSLTSTDPSNFAAIATLWRDGKTYDLNSLIDPSVAQYVILTVASGINNSGSIVAEGSDTRYPNVLHGYLLKLPRGEPHTK